MASASPVESNQAFTFLEPGELIDQELELVEPSDRWLNDMVQVLSHPLTQKEHPGSAESARQGVRQFLERHPRGRQEPRPSEGIVPGYHFWMRLRPEAKLPVALAGTINLRLGNTPRILLYAGHIGYGVYPPCRGRHYAERACRLLLPLARRHGLRELWITTNPQNVASRRTCQRLGAEFIEIVPIAENEPLYVQGERYKCRYRLPLQ